MTLVMNTLSRYVRLKKYRVNSNPSQNAFFHFKSHIFANNSKTAGFRPFSLIFNPPPKPILPPSDLIMTKLL